LPDLARAVSVSPYLVGDTLTRADVTLASMLAAPLGHPSDDLFTLAPFMRGMFGLPLAEEPAIRPLARWRDDLYRRHRGGCVKPPG
jgi:glutathione S-transferase